MGLSNKVTSGGGRTVKPVNEMTDEELEAYQVRRFKANFQGPRRELEALGRKHDAGDIDDEDIMFAWREMKDAIQGFEARVRTILAERKAEAAEAAKAEAEAAKGQGQ